MTVYLIDGYNVLHELLGHGRGMPGHESASAQLHLEEERHRLIDRIASFMGGTSDRAIVVFDSQARTLQKTETATSGVDVYFASFHRSADSIIEREVYALSAGENVVVVSSDYGLQKVIFRPNVIRRSSRQFVADLQEHTRTIANTTNCITMGNRIEERIAPEALNRLKALREQLEAEPECGGRGDRSDGGSDF